MRCPSCSKVATVRALVEYYGYRNRVECECGHMVKITYLPDEQPQYPIDHDALNAMPELVREAAIAHGTIPTKEVLPFGVRIDVQTPVWVWIDPH